MHYNTLQNNAPLRLYNTSLQCTEQNLHSTLPRNTIECITILMLDATLQQRTQLKQHHIRRYSTSLNLCCTRLHRTLLLPDLTLHNDVLYYITQTIPCHTRPNAMLPHITLPGHYCTPHDPTLPIQYTTLHYIHYTIRHVALPDSAEHLRYDIMQNHNHTRLNCTIAALYSIAHNFTTTIPDSTSPVLYDILRSVTVPNCDCTESIAHNLGILYLHATIRHQTKLKRDITAPNGTTPNATELIQYLTKPNHTKQKHYLYRTFVLRHYAKLNQHRTVQYVTAQYRNDTTLYDTRLNGAKQSRYWSMLHFTPT